MSLIDRYVLKEWVLNFGLVLFALLGLLTLFNMLDSGSDLFDMKVGFVQGAFYYLLLIPAYLKFVLPIAILVSLFLSLGNFHRNNEIVAMRASGLGLLKISRSLWAAGILLTGLLVYMTTSVVPQSVELSRTFFENLNYASQEKASDSKGLGLVYNLGFDNSKDGRLWLMNRFSERAWLGLGVNVFTRGSHGEELNRISAAEAYFDDTRGYWVFLNGRELIFDSETGDPMRMISFEEKKFKDFHEDPNLMLTLHKDPDELSIFELRKIIKTISPEENPMISTYLVSYYALLAMPFSCLIVVGLAVPFSVFGVRSNPMIGILICMCCILAFYLLISISTILGERQAIPALMAAWLPNFIMFGAAAWLFRQAR